jgi:hypothetical protein
LNKVPVPFDKEPKYAKDFWRQSDRFAIPQQKALVSDQAKITKFVDFSFVHF